MKKKQGLDRHYAMLNHLSHLPRRILSLSGADNITEFVLHDLCGEECFNLTKAAYFIDNPDFNCLKGIAGFSIDSVSDGCVDKWHNPEQFSGHMRGCTFNQSVRNIMRCSVKNNKESDEHIAAELAHDLGFKHHNYCSWNMKHNNHGLFVYEKAEDDDAIREDDLINGLCLLSFCPVF